MEKFRVGDVVVLPETHYPGVIGIVIQEGEQKCLVHFNGTEQLYFELESLRHYLD